MNGLRFSTTSAASASHGVKVLVYSQAGAGKTLLSATAPAPLVISAESGLLSLRPDNIRRAFGADTPGITYDLPVITVGSVEELTAAYNWCAQNAARHGLQTLCLDSLTEIAEQVLAAAKAKSKDPRQAYGALIDQMMVVVKAFRDLPGLNVYMTAKMDKDRDAVDNVTRFAPMMPGSRFGSELPYLFDEVFFLGVATDEQRRTFRYLRTQPDIQYTAKDRSGALDVYEQPNLTNVFRKILGA